MGFAVQPWGKGVTSRIYGVTDIGPIANHLIYDGPQRVGDERIQLGRFVVIRQLTPPLADATAPTAIARTAPARADPASSRGTRSRSCESSRSSTARGG